MTKPNRQIASRISRASALELSIPRDTFQKMIFGAPLVFISRRVTSRDAIHYSHQFTAGLGIYITREL